MIIYRMRQITELAYVATQEWLSEQAEAFGYQEIRYTAENVKQHLEATHLLSAAFQFSAFFPTHFFKVKHTLHAIIGEETIASWIRFNPYLSCIDIGCGSGAATIAFLEYVGYIKAKYKINHDLRILLTGTDPNGYGLVIYEHLFSHYRPLLENIGIFAEFELFYGGIPQDTSKLILTLQRVKERWGIPYIPKALIFQVNVVSPFNRQYLEQDETRRIFERFGVANKKTEPFGQLQSIEYRSIFEQVGIDHLHIVTIGTDHYMLPERVREMGIALMSNFGTSRHQTTELLPEAQRMKFYNPLQSYWRLKGYESYKPTDPFHIHICNIDNADIASDTQWANVTNLDNLELAWARVRRGLVDESIYDEIELRIFERDLENNLVKLRAQLLSYAKSLLPTDDTMAYKTPKNKDAARPRGLSRLEEEILSVAVIQVLGRDTSALRERSYAYRLGSESPTEYLFEPWFDSYKKFVEAAKTVAQQVKGSHPRAKVTRYDISSFFTRILQAKLAELTSENLGAGERLKWLIELLLTKNLDAPHLSEQGLVQGGIGSGFYANLYLTPLDVAFGTSNVWHVEFFRYVDDMIFIIPDPEDEAEIVSVLERTLKELNLELNKKKEEPFNTVDEFLAATEPDTDLTKLSLDSDRLFNSVWAMNKAQRDQFRVWYSSSDDVWWNAVTTYQRCLIELEIYIQPDDLSRKIYKYLFNSRRVSRESSRRHRVNFPELPLTSNLSDTKEWAKSFRKRNPHWVIAQRKLKQTLYDMFSTALERHRREVAEDNTDKRNTQRLRFSLNKLVSFGLAPILNEIVSILHNEPWLIRDPIHKLENLAAQGFQTEIWGLIRYYEESSHPMGEYMRAVAIRALRFLPSFVDFNWQFVVNVAFNGSLIERLMATELWIYAAPQKELLPSDAIDSVLFALEQNQHLPYRLRRNYYVLVKLYSVSIAQVFFPELQELDELLNQHVDLFDLPEPSQLRRNFYSGKGRLDDGTRDRDY